MKILKPVLLFCLALGISSCDEIAKQLGYSPIESKSESTPEIVENTSSSTSNIISEFEVTADVYKMVPDYYGSASGKEVYKGTEKLKITVYKDGSAYAGSMPIYRAVGEAGEKYDFNCFNNNTSKSYYFNTSKLN